MPEAMKAERIEYHVAYGAFLFSGLVVVGVAVLSALPLDTGVAGGIGFLVVIPLYVLALLAMLVGIGLGVRLRHDRRLLLQAAVAATVIANLGLDFVPPAFSNVLPGLYGGLVIVCSAIWFGR